MAVNVRKPLSFKNKTNYFSPDTSATKVTVVSQNSQLALSSKQQGYYNRLFWEFKFCNDNDGQTFFYTLTYNNRSLPRFEGKPCFDYKDLVYLLNGGFKQFLKRHFGTSFKYFVGAELGEGSGSRGMHQNPHYHILFFLRPDGSDVPYKKISPIEFRHLIRHYWQGFDESVDGFRSYKTAKFGIAKEGENLGFVTDFRACAYVSKYVSKDVGLRRFEKSLSKRLRYRFLNDIKTKSEIHESFWLDYLNPHYNIPTRCHCDGKRHFDWKFSDVELLKRLSFRAFALFNEMRVSKKDAFLNVYGCVPQVVKDLNLNQVFSDFSDDFIERKISDRISEFRNRFSNKCRISQGVGDYALEFIKDKNSPSIPLPTKDGIVYKPIGLYYYRKLFTTVVKDPLGNPIRILNDAGIDYKVNKLSSDIGHLVSVTDANLEIISSDFYNQMINSDVNTDVSLPYNYFIETINHDKPLIIKRYAEFKLIYESRYFKVQSCGSDENFNFPCIDPIVDFRRFIKPSYFFQPYDFNGLSDFIESGCEGYMPYSFHPYFRQYVDCFSVLDLLSAYLFCEGDEFYFKQDQEVKKTRKFHKGLDLQSFYKQFN